MIAIRLAGDDDLPALIAMMRAFEAHLNAMAPDGGTQISEDRRAAMATWLIGPQPFRGVLLAAGAAPLGYAAFSEMAWMDDGAPALWLSDLYIAPEARGQGVGRALMDALRSEARVHGAERVVFTVWRRNAPARAFYAALGAEVVGEEILMTLPV